MNNTQSGFLIDNIMFITRKHIVELLSESLSTCIYAIKEPSKHLAQFVLYINVLKEIIQQGLLQFHR